MCAVFIDQKYSDCCEGTTHCRGGEMMPITPKHSEDRDMPFKTTRLEARRYGSPLLPRLLKSPKHILDNLIVLGRVACLTLGALNLLLAPGTLLQLPALSIVS